MRKRKQMKSKDINILNQFNILYLEDDVDLLKHTTDILEDFVHTIYSVRTAKEALEVLLHNKVDVIISDILLQNESGLVFLKQIKDEHNIHIPTILTTAHTDMQYLLDAIKLKVENYIVKPINVKELLDTLHDVLLPKVQQKEIQKNAYIIRTVSAITDSKQVEVVKYILDSLNKKNQFIASYTDIMGHVTISKPTLIKLFKVLANKGILTKTEHKTYQFNEGALPR